MAVDAGTKKKAPIGAHVILDGRVCRTNGNRAWLPGQTGPVVGTNRDRLWDKPAVVCLIAHSSCHFQGSSQGDWNFILSEKQEWPEYGWRIYNGPKWTFLGQNIGPFWSREYQNPVRSKVILTVQYTFRQYSGDSLVQNGRFSWTKF